MIIRPALAVSLLALVLVAAAAEAQSITCPPGS
jgi:hypothetical protein